MHSYKLYKVKETQQSRYVLVFSIIRFLKHLFTFLIFFGKWYWSLGTTWEKKHLKTRVIFSFQCLCLPQFRRIQKHPPPLYHSCLSCLACGTAASLQSIPRSEHAHGYSMFSPAEDSTQTHGCPSWKSQVLNMPACTLLPAFKPFLNCFLFFWITENRQSICY